MGAGDCEGLLRVGVGAQHRTGSVKGDRREGPELRNQNLRNQDLRCGGKETHKRQKASQK